MGWPEGNTVKMGVRARDIVLCIPSLIKTNQSLHVESFRNPKVCLCGCHSGCFRSAEAKGLFCPRDQFPEKLASAVTTELIRVGSQCYPFPRDADQR